MLVCRYIVVACLLFSPFKVAPDLTGQRPILRMGVIHWCVACVGRIQGASGVLDLQLNMLRIRLSIYRYQSRKAEE